MSIDLVRIDNRHASTASGNRSAFLVIRNEEVRLPYHLEYHRALGIEQFFFVDNGSTDGTLDLLLSQPDCHVFQPQASFPEANYGMDWVNALVERFGIGNWCLFLEADELFTYPHAESVSLADLCRFLDQTGSEGLFALLLDMYGMGPIAEANYTPGSPFLQTCHYFDRDYIFRRKPGPSRNRQGPIASEVSGGPRLRRFYPEFCHTGSWRLALLRVLHLLRRQKIGTILGLHHTSLGRDIPPELTKIPLIKGRAGRRWISSRHSPPLTLSEVTGSLLRFDFFSDFHARADAEAERRQHRDDGAEYIRYASVLARDPDLSLLYRGSCPYRSTRDLIRLGLIRSSPEFDRYAKLTRAADTRRPVVQSVASRSEPPSLARTGEVIPFPQRRVRS